MVKMKPLSIKLATIVAVITLSTITIQYEVQAQSQSVREDSCGNSCSDPGSRSPRKVPELSSSLSILSTGVIGAFVVLRKKCR